MNRRGLPVLPTIAEPFPAAFRDLLREILSRGPRLHGDRVEQLPRRRAAYGTSGTFAGHRPYVCGDDLRRLDWAAYARSDELFIKQLEEEERRVATILLDLSPRLAVGTPPRRLAALRLAAVIGGLALRHLDGLTVIAPGADGTAVSTFAGVADIDRLLTVLTELPFVDADPDAGMPLVLRHGTRGRVHWLSDFTDPRAAERALGLLRRRGGRAIGWLPSLPEDREPPQQGYVEVADPVTGERLVLTVDRALRAAMQRELDVLRRAQDRVFAQSGCALVRWPVPPEGDVSWRTYEEVLRQCRT